MLLTVCDDERLQIELKENPRGQDIAEIGGAIQLVIGDDIYYIWSDGNVQVRTDDGEVIEYLEFNLRDAALNARAAEKEELTKEKVAVG